MSDEIEKMEERIKSGLPILIKERADALIELDKDMVGGIVHAAFIAGMQLAMRICRNRAKAWEELGGTMRPEQEDLTCAHLIRSVQVEIGSGRMPRPQFSKEELEEMDRIS